jgi:hypothetical protein
MLIIYEAQRATDRQFVEFWSSQYSYAQEYLYCDNIGRELTEARIFCLFRWKNGTPLSDLKRDSLRQNFVRRAGELRQIDPNRPVRELLDVFANGGVIWRIFWLHCWQPKRWPIYDQHVFRAMSFIQSGRREEIPARDPEKIESYVSCYLPFHERFSDMNLRHVDRALWRFGKFLKEEAYFPTTLDPNA